MKHVGDITKLNGAELEPVDCICGGSPCQDLSVAGLRAGLQGQRSGLFMEQVRIVKEMRENERRNGRSADLVRPRYMVWENVPGAFSSNGGKDFQAVLTEIIRIAEPEAPDVPMPEKGGWSKSGCIYDDLGKWSVCWRVHDAQFWGVPQRRKRIALVADFGGLSAPEICFERKGLRWHHEPGGEKGEETAGTSGKGTDSAIGFSNRGYSSGDVTETIRSGSHGSNPMAVVGRDGQQQGDIAAISFQERAGKPGGGKGILIQNERVGALSTLNNQSVCYGISSFDSNAMKSKNPHSGIYEAETARTLDMQGGNPACNQGGVFVLEGNGSRPSHYGDGWAESEISYTLNGTEQHAVCVGFKGGQSDGGIGYEEEKAPTLSATPSALEPTILCLKDQGGSTTNTSVDVTGALRAEEHGHQPIMIEMTSTKNTIVEEGVSPTITARMGTGGNQVNAICMDVGFFQTEEEKAGALLARQYKDPPITYQDKCGSLLASGYQKNGTQEASNDMYVAGDMVRRLTPKECERLQGFPDGWTDIGEWVDSKGKKRQCTDGARYKALGNSIALPYWFYLLRRISAQYERPATLGSLFDGISGFCLCWERCNGRGTARWASEIEEFPIAVAKKHFGDEEKGIEGDIGKYL